MSDSTNHKLYIVPEVTRGTTPLTPALATVRHTSCNIALAKETFQSAEIQTHRNVQDMRHGNRQVGGEFGFELSAASFDTMFEALLMGAWTTNACKIGTQRRTFSILRNFADQAAGDKPWHNFLGCEFNKMTLSAVAGKPITGSFGIIGKNLTYNGTAPTGATYPAVSTGRVFSAFSGSANINSAAALITEFSLTVENGLSPNFVLFSDQSDSVSMQVCKVTGNLGMYFANSAMLENFLNESNLALSIQLTEGAKSYTIALPACVLTGGQPDVSGQGPVMLKLPFEAIYEPTAQTSLSIIRVP